VLDTWRAKATTVTGRPLDCGHLLPEGRPGEVLAEIRSFFREGSKDATVVPEPHK